MLYKYAIFADVKNDTMKLRLIILFLFISILDIYPSDVKFYSINAMYGISMRETYSVCKDDNGFIWASSKTGVLRLTEGNYRIYQLPYKTADVISAQLTYSNSFLVAYTNNGQLFLYDELYDRFNLLLDLRVPLEYLYLNVSKIIIAADHTLWISPSIGLCKYKNGQLTKIDKESVEVDKVKGARDVCLIFKGGEDELFNFDSWKFVK